MTVEDLAARVGMDPDRLIRIFAGLGEYKTPDSVLSDEEIDLIYEEVGYRSRGR